MRSAIENRVSRRKFEFGNGGIFHLKQTIIDLGKMFAARNFKEKQREKYQLWRTPCLIMW